MQLEAGPPLSFFAYTVAHSFETFSMGRLERDFSALAYPNSFSLLDNSKMRISGTSVSRLPIDSCRSAQDQTRRMPLKALHAG